MPLAQGGGNRPRKDYIVDQKDLDGAEFLITYIGKAFYDSTYHYKKIPVEVVLPAGIRVLEFKPDGENVTSEDGTEAVWFARGKAIVGEKDRLGVLEEEGTEAPVQVSLARVQGADKEKAAYYELSEIVSEAAE